jgi:hypothetical protein
MSMGWQVHDKGYNDLEQQNLVQKRLGTDAVDSHRWQTAFGTV